MSYYIFRKKLFIEVQEEKIMPLVLYSDSSTRYCDTGLHPSTWCINDITGGGRLLVPKHEFEKAREEMLKEELKRLNEFYSRHEPEKMPANKESWLYSGNSYPGGRKVKNMYYFFSTRNTVSPDYFFARNRSGFEIEAFYYDRSNFKHVQNQKYLIRCEEDMLDADQRYQDFFRTKPEQYGMSLGVSSIWI